MRRTQGFTLLEMLTALAVFSLLAAVVYATVEPAGKGFGQIAEARDDMQRGSMVSRQLRLDISYLCPSQDRSISAIRVKFDNRGGQSFDQLWLLVRDTGQPGLSLVHYFLDEASGKLVRETILPWARDGQQAMRWKMGSVSAFEVRAMDEAGNWQMRWDSKDSGKLPKAVRVRWQDDRGEREHVFPVFVDYTPLEKKT